MPLLKFVIPILFACAVVFGADEVPSDSAKDSPPADTPVPPKDVTALINAYDLVPDGIEATIYTDSNLAVQTINDWASGWEKRGWTRKTGPIQNLDLIKVLYAKAQARPELRLVWIKAHDGSRWNEYADSLSTAWMRDEV